MIQILDLTPMGTYAGSHTPIYKFGHSFPWVRTTDVVRATIEDAYADAQEWARSYQAADRFGNMACALGVAKEAEGYVGVVTYFHSNT